MKSRLTPLQLTALIGVLAIGVLGGLGYYFVSGQLADAQQQLANQVAVRNHLLQAAIAPAESNIRSLTDDIKLLTDADARLEARMKTSGNKLADVVPKNPVLFKQELGADQKALTDLARTNGVQVPTNFAYGFSMYNSLTPLDRDTVFLGKQLLGIEELVKILVAARVDRLLNVRRTFDELPSRNGTPDSVGESLTGKSITVESGIYTVYPLQVEFLGRPQALREFLNKLLASPYMLIVRSVRIESTKLDPARLDNLAKQSELAQADASNGHSGSASALAKPPVFAVGFEAIKAIVRVDLVDWTGAAKSPSSAKTTAPHNQSGL